MTRSAVARLKLIARGALTQFVACALRVGRAGSRAARNGTRSAPIDRGAPEVRRRAQTREITFARSTIASLKLIAIDALIGFLIGAAL